MFFSKFVLSPVCLIPLLTFAADPSVDPKPVENPTLVIKEVPVKVTSPVSGREMFDEYCAACHGSDAKGHGPALAALKVPPPDLTLLSRNNHGKFPGQHVYSAIRGDVNLNAHGSADMPVWGRVFRDMAGNAGSAQADIRMANLCLYIESLQQK
jgi:mono/diheme cytochrome c family protein